MKARKPPFQWVRVVWLDAFSEDPWFLVDDYVIHDQLVHSEGFLVRENERYVMLAPNVAYNHEESKWETFAATAIPKAMMQKPLKIVRKAPGGRHGKAKDKAGNGDTANGAHHGAQRSRTRAGGQPARVETVSAGDRGSAGSEGHAGQPTPRSQV